MLLRARWIPSSLVFPDADTDIFDAFIPPPPVNIIHPKPTPNLAFRSVDCFFLLSVTCLFNFFIHFSQIYQPLSLTRLLYIFLL